MEKILWMMCAPPGAGKTWVAKNILMRGLGWRYISRDEIRFSLLKDKDKYFDHEKEAFNIFVENIKKALDEEGVFNVIADATHVTWNSRKKLLNALHLKEDNVIVVVVENELREMLQNNEMRTGRPRVEPKVIKSMYRQMLDPENDPISYRGILRINNYRGHVR